MTISEVEEVADASFTQTPMMANMKLAKSIHSDCTRMLPVQQRDVSISLAGIT
jgi:hypothetical protein